MIPASLPDPKEYSYVTLGGIEYELKFRAGDVIRLNKEHGLDLLAGVPISARGTEAMERTCLLLRYALAHVKEFSDRELQDMIPLEQFAEIIVALRVCQKKVATQFEATMEAAYESGALDRPTETAPPVIQ